MACTIPVNFGEVYDKISILELKRSRVHDPVKLQHVDRELSELRRAVGVVHVPDELAALQAELHDVNSQLWDIEDELRVLERHGEFGDVFVLLARNVYVTNDWRSRVKKKINCLLNSGFHEVKSFEPTEGRDAVLVIHHLGMGDHLIMNGFVRYLAEKAPSVVLVCYDHYKESVKFMFRDLPGVEVVTIQDGEEGSLIRACQQRALETRCPRACFVGMYDRPDWDHQDPPAKVFWEPFYTGHGLDPGVMRSHFKVLRNPMRERQFYQDFVAHVGSEQYVIVHENSARNMLLKRDLVPIPPGYACINVHGSECPVHSNVIFDYCMVLERAHSFHGFDSSFAWLIELLGLRVRHKFLHVYIKDVGSGFASRAYGNSHSWVEVC